MQEQIGQITKIVKVSTKASTKEEAIFKKPTYFDRIQEASNLFNRKAKRQYCKNYKLDWADISKISMIDNINYIKKCQELVIYDSVYKEHAEKIAKEQAKEKIKRDAKLATL